MTVHLCTFATDDMSRSRELCVLSTRHHGVNIVHEYQPSGVASAFIGHEAIWNNPKGCGLWAWKPMIILATLDKIGVAREQFNLTQPDYLVYSDAGIEFINNVSHIIERMGHDKPQDDVWLFGNNWMHHHWCKQSVIETIWPVRGIADVATRMRIDCQRFGKQCQASVIFFRVSEYSRAFVAEWLKWCLWNNGELIDDSPSWIGNHPEFREHRHDQAILTTMAYREGIPVHWWPAVYNKGGSPEFVYEKLPEYAGDDYPVLFSHNRKRNHEWGSMT